MPEIMQHIRRMPTHDLVISMNNFPPNRELGEIGQKYGCSIVLCHIHPVRGKGAYHLNIANTGLGEAILCRNGHAIPLTVTHSPASNPTERTRVVDAKGFISQVGVYQATVTGSA